MQLSRFWWFVGISEVTRDLRGNAVILQMFPPTTRAAIGIKLPAIGPHAGLALACNEAPFIAERAALRRARLSRALSRGQALGMTPSVLAGCRDAPQAIRTMIPASAIIRQRAEELLLAVGHRGAGVDAAQHATGGPRAFACFSIFFASLLL